MKNNNNNKASKAEEDLGTWSTQLAIWEKNETKSSKKVYKVFQNTNRNLSKIFIVFIKCVWKKGKLEILKRIRWYFFSFLRLLIKL